MKKLLIIFLLICLLTSPIWSQWPYQQKPMMGMQVNGSHPLSAFVGAWFFLELSGNKVFDLSGNGNAGTFVGSPTWDSGKFGSAMNFPGTGSGAYISCGVPVNPPSGSYSCSIWVNFQDLAASTEQIIGNMDNDDDDSGWAIFWFDGNIVHSTPTAGLHNNTTYAWTATGVWVNISVSWDDSIHESKLYINGVLVDTESGNDYTYVDSITHFIIGANSGGNNLREFEGLVDHATFYDGVRSASEIALLYREPFCMFTEDNVAFMTPVAAPAPTGGQFISIQMTAIPLLVFFLTLIRLKHEK